MKLKALSTAMILATVPMTGAFAAGMDRSGQSIAAFLQPGNYFEAGISVLDPNVSGKVKNGYTPSPSAPASMVGLQNTNLSDMADDYYFPAAALKLQLTDQFSFGLLYDQPFGAEATYAVNDQGSTLLGGVGLFHDGNDATSVEVDTQTLSVVLGYQPTENFNFYGGGVYQTVKGDVQLRGLAYGGADNFGGYNAKIGEDSAVGWLAGFAYQIPEIALKASVTYRSEIDHKVTIDESSIASVGLNPGTVINMHNGQGQTEITTPQSVNLDFQTGIMANTVAFANVRWVDWSSFSIRPHAFGKASEAASTQLTQGAYTKGFNLVDYSDDQISATVGVGRKLNDQWAGNVSVGWDSGAGNPVSTLGPTEGYWNVGLGVQYSPAPNYFIAGGVKYFMLGDATAHSGAYSIPGNAQNAQVATFEDNDAWAYGLKIGYRF
ncbi:OmpP1/FadL family transporter [Acinetobacter towneri]|uniref:Transporter n=1 Tax=Acinetobacter towneri TaxID=202956 RepID=A0AAP9GT42_9GAMM|nr:outer membrane protein transport protein [Acinetobacter towneri]QGM27038.1 transporter [Acinetobacter towneri]